MPDIKDHPNWVLSCPKTKAPFCAADPTRHASSTDPSTWVDYETAKAVANERGMLLAFCPSETDPFCAIDLDNKEGCSKRAAVHAEILAMYEGYAEITQSGKGYRLFVLGSVPSIINNRQWGVEASSQGHFWTVTFNTLPGRTGFYPADLRQFYARFAPNPVYKSDYTWSTEGEADDAKIWDKIQNNGQSGKKAFEVFNRGYQTTDRRSEEDATLITNLCFATTNDDAVLRIAQQSKAWLSRPHHSDSKRQRGENFLRKEIIKNRQWRQPIETRVDPLLTQVYTDSAAPSPEPKDELTIAPGLLGEVQQYLLDSARYPNMAMALAGSFTFFGGVCGFSWLYDELACNQYCFVIANTGAGKGDVVKGLEKLTKNFDAKVFSEDNPRPFRYPEVVPSPQGLRKMFTPEKRTGFSIFKEGASLLDNSSADKRNAFSIEVPLTAMYDESGEFGMFDGSANADPKNRAKPIARPCFSFLADVQPDRFQDYLTLDKMKSGYVPRLLVFATDAYWANQKPQKNRQKNIPKTLEKRIIALMHKATMSMHNAAQGKAVEIKATQETIDLIEQYEEEIKQHVRDNLTPAEGYIYNRTAMKGIKIAMQCAIGMCEDNEFDNIVMTKKCVDYGMKISRLSSNYLFDLYKQGYVGSDAAKADRIIFDAFASAKQAKNKSLKLLPPAALKNGWVPLSYVTNTVRNNGKYKELTNTWKISAVKDHVLSLDDRIEKMPDAQAEELGWPKNLYRLTGE